MDNDSLFAVTSEGKLVFRRGVNAGVPGGEEWLEIPSSTGDMFTSVAVDTQGRPWLLSKEKRAIFTRDGVCLANPAGSRWIQVPGAGFQSICAHPEQGLLLAINGQRELVARQGVEPTNLVGDSWMRISTPEPLINLALSFKGHVLWACSDKASYLVPSADIAASSPNHTPAWTKFKAPCKRWRHASMGEHYALMVDEKEQLHAYDHDPALAAEKHGKWKAIRSQVRHATASSIEGRFWILDRAAKLRMVTHADRKPSFKDLKKLSSKGLTVDDTTTYACVAAGPAAHHRPRNPSLSSSTGLSSSTSSQNRPTSPLNQSTGVSSGLPSVGEAPAQRLGSNQDPEFVEMRQKFSTLKIYDAVRRRKSSRKAPEFDISVRIARGAELPPPEAVCDFQRVTVPSRQEIMVKYQLTAV